MKTIGAGANATLAMRPAIVDAGGVRVAFFGFSDINPLGFSATSTTPGTASADPEAIARAVRAARRHADVVVCFMHWGVELHAAPDSRQGQLAAACIGAGAQVVLGAHPHVLGPVLRPTSRTLVAWTPRELRVPVERRDRAQRGPPGAARRTRRARLPAASRRDRRLPPAAATARRSLTCRAERPCGRVRRRRTAGPCCGRQHRLESRPLHGRGGVAPSSSCHDATSVAPFQLAYSGRRGAASAGRSAGRPTHGKRNAR